MISAENIENLAQGEDHTENALLAAREIVKWLDGIEAVYLPHEYYNDAVGESVYWDYDGMVLLIESIIAYQYGEEPRNESIPFS